MIRYTLYLIQPDGFSRVHASGVGPGLDLGTPTLPDALLAALGALYGDRWRLEPAWAGGWRVIVDRPDAVIPVGYIDYGPAPAETDPRQVGLFG